jgi:hypothetical protein
MANLSVGPGTPSGLITFQIPAGQHFAGRLRRTASRKPPAWSVSLRPSWLAKGPDNRRTERRCTNYCTPAYPKSPAFAIVRAAGRYASEGTELCAVSAETLASNASSHFIVLPQNSIPASPSRLVIRLAHHALFEPRFLAAAASSVKPSFTIRASSSLFSPPPWGGFCGLQIAFVGTWRRRPLSARPIEPAP